MSIFHAFTILSCFLLLPGSARQGNLPKTNYKDYHTALNKAYKIIAGGGYEQGVFIIQKTFEQYDYVFARDAWNALKITLLADNDAATGLCLEKCIKAGIGKDYFLNDRFIREHSKPWVFEELAKNYAALRKSYNESISQKKNQRYSSMYNKEQACKQQPCYVSSVRDHFQCIMAECDSLYFPGERSIGIDNPHYLPEKGTLSLGNSKVMATLYHWPDSYTALEEKLDGYVVAGLIHPRDLALIYIYQKMRLSVLYTYNTPAVDLPLHFNMAYEKISTDTDYVDSCRALFHLCGYGTEVALEQLSKDKKMGLLF